ARRIEVIARGFGGRPRAVAVLVHVNAVPTGLESGHRYDDLEALVRLDERRIAVRLTVAYRLEGRRGADRAGRARRRDLCLLRSVFGGLGAKRRIQALALGVVRSRGRLVPLGGTGFARSCADIDVARACPELRIGFCAGARRLQSIARLAAPVARADARREHDRRSERREARAPARIKCVVSVHGRDSFPAIESTCSKMSAKAGLRSIY